jgi:hypothetical protein
MRHSFPHSFHLFGAGCLGLALFSAAPALAQSSDPVADMAARYNDLNQRSYEADSLARDQMQRAQDAADMARSETYRQADEMRRPTLPREHYWNRIR